MYENENENEKMCVNDNHLIDYLANEDNFKNVPQELLEEGKSVIDAHPQIANGQLFIITPENKAFLIRVEGMENVRERELNESEYKIAGIL